ncbi:tripartite tricarboxylate transporter TctB family protein [Rhizobiaceae bacterium BDR2-2]|uniref:Tripartite tricarboxylate transporter TctB family protein n=1 Tax=Ectorhizobium quercum TaxID=2965071 RepID=A0AAE3MY29_9HYPH|nr:tripartite tricarboxylate transporter TctB family protein [Ectorhizobium quercum]MCX8997338.1 tripartite tricarboxylate transporter TctB family protein [Ectorhizobium quercum]
MNRMDVLLRNKDVLSGLFFLLVAAVFAYGALRLPMGSAIRMGPGYFPLVLSGMLAFFGVLTVLTGVRNASERNAVSSIAWLRLLLVSGSALFFAIALDGLGFPITVFVTILIAARASKDFRLVPALLLAALSSAAAWFIFAGALGLPLAALGSWLTGA